MTLFQRFFFNLTNGIILGSILECLSLIEMYIQVWTYSKNTTHYYRFCRDWCKTLHVFTAGFLFIVRKSVGFMRTPLLAWKFWLNDFFFIRNVSGPSALIMIAYFFLDVIERLLVLNVLGLKDITASVKEIHICLNPMILVRGSF